MLSLRWLCKCLIIIATFIASDYQPCTLVTAMQSDGARTPATCEGLTLNGLRTQ